MNMHRKNRSKRSLRRIGGFKVRSELSFLLKHIFLDACKVEMSREGCNVPAVRGIYFGSRNWIRVFSCLHKTRQINPKSIRYIFIPFEHVYSQEQLLPKSSHETSHDYNRNECKLPYLKRISVEYNRIDGENTIREIH